MALNFPNTGLYVGYQYTGDNGVVYIYDGVKWVGHSPNITPGSNSISNGPYIVQVDGTGNLVIPDGATIIYQSGGPVANTGTSWTVTPSDPGNNCPIFAELTPDHFQAYTQNSHLDLFNDGTWYIGSNYNGLGLFGIGNTATLYSNRGDVIVRVNDSQSNFIFGNDGNLTVPESIKFPGNASIKQGMGFDISSESAILLQSVDATDPNNKFYNNWVFGSDGSLTVPSNSFPTTFTVTLTPEYFHGHIGRTVLTLNGAPWQYTVTFDINDDGNILAFHTNQTHGVNPGYQNGDIFNFGPEITGIPGYTFRLNLSGISYTGTEWTTIAQSAVPPLFVPAIVAETDLKFTSNGYDLILNRNGSLILPGNLRFPTSYTIDSSAGNDGIRLTTDRGTVLFGNKPECVPTAQTHFHIMKEDTDNVELFLGDDLNYVKLPGTQDNSYGVEVGTTGELGANIWRFGTDGTLTLPSTGTIVNLESSGIKLKTSQGLLSIGDIDALTSTSHFHIRMDQNPSDTFPGGIDLFFGDDSQFLRLANDGSVAVQARMGSGAPTIIAGSPTELVNETSNFEYGYFLLDGTTAAVYVAWDGFPIADGDIVVFSDSPIAELNNTFYARNVTTGTYVGTIILYVDPDLLTPADPTGWGSAPGGTLSSMTLPGDAVLSGGADTTGLAYGGDAVVEGRNVYVNAGINEWTFGEDGALTVAKDIVVGTNNGHIYIDNDPAGASSIRWVNLNPSSAMLRVWSDGRNDLNNQRLELGYDLLGGLYITTTQNVDGTGNNPGDDFNWTFGSDGTTVFPNNTIKTTTSTNITVLGRSTLAWYNIFGELNNSTSTNVTSNGSVVYDNEGNLYVLGSTVDNSSNSFDGKNLFIKYSPQGELLWRKTWTDDSGDACGSYNASMRFVPMAGTATIDAIAWASNGQAWSSDYHAGYIGTMDLEGNLVDLQGQARAPLAITDYRITDILPAEYPGFDGAYISGSWYDRNDTEQNYASIVGVDFNNTGSSVNYIFVPADQYNNGSAHFKSINGSGPALWATGAYPANTYNGNTKKPLLGLIGFAGSPTLYLYTIGDNYSAYSMWIEDSGSDADSNIYALINVYGYNHSVSSQENSYTVVASATPNTTITIDRWQKKIDRVGANDGSFSTLGLGLATHNGYVYVAALLSDISGNDSDLALLKLNANTGELIWARTIGSPSNEDSNGLYEDGYNSSSDITIDPTGTYISLSANTQDRSTGTQYSNNLTIQYPVDGTLLGMYGDFTITDSTADFLVTDHDFTVTNIIESAIATEAPLNVTTATLTASATTVGSGWTNLRQTIGYPDQTWTFGQDGTLTLPNTDWLDSGTPTLRTTQDFSIGVGESQKVWNFDQNGDLTLPESSTIKPVGGNLTISNPAANNKITLETDRITIQTTGGYTNWWSMYGDLDRNFSSEYGAGSVYDANGNLYVVGTFKTDGPDNLLLLKYNSVGELIWSKSYSSNNDFNNQIHGESILFDNNSGHLFILTTQEQSWYGIIEITTDGEIVRGIHGDVDQEMNAVDFTIDNSGNIYVLADLQGNPLAASNNNIIVKLDAATLDDVWAKSISLGHPVNEPNQGQGFGAIVYSNGYVYVTGGVNPGGPNIAFIAKFDASTGDQQWINDAVIPGGNSGMPGAVGMGICLDPDDNVYITLVADYENGASIIVKYNSSGVFQWSQQLMFYQGGGDVDINYYDGYVYATGVIYSGQGTGPSSSGNPGWIHWAKVNATTGDIVYQQVFGSSFESSAADVWRFKGHDLGSIYNDKLSISAFVYESLTTSTEDANMMTLQLPLTAVTTGTYGQYQVWDFIPESSTFFTNTDWLSVGSGVTATVYLGLAGNETYTNWTTSTVTVDEPLTYFTRGFGDNSGLATWNFIDGNIILPPGGNIFDNNGNSVLGGSNVSSDRLTAGTATVVLNDSGSIELPLFGRSGSGIARLQSHNGYPTLMAYGSSGTFGIHGGPELDWMNSDYPTEDFFNTATTRHTLYLNGEGLYIGMNENGVTGSPQASWTFDPNGNLTLPNNAGHIDTSNNNVDIFATNQRGKVILTGATHAGYDGGRVVINGGDGADNSTNLRDGGRIEIAGGQGFNGGVGGTINLSTYDALNNAHNWLFDTDGSFTLAGALVNSTTAIFGSGDPVYTTAIDLTKSINKLGDNVGSRYTLADGVEGQIIYLVRQHNVTDQSLNSIGIVVANGYQGINVIPNQTLYFNGDMITLIFTDGAWQQTGGLWD